MQRYVEQLIEEIKEITDKVMVENNFEDEAITDDESFFRHIENVEHFLYGEPVPISQITGIIPEQLPPPEKLSKEQITQLVETLEVFLEKFHFTLAFPQNYPKQLRYPFIQKFWSEEHIRLQGGQNHIEFCSYNEDECPFPGYCTICDEIRNDARQMNSNNTEDELPF